MPKSGITAIAKTIKPMPPIHCNNCLYNNKDSGRTLRFGITVAPVVVIPDIDSKKESINVIPLRIKGIEPAEDKTIQKSVITKKPSLWVISSVLFLEISHPRKPTIKTTEKVITKIDKAPSLYIKDVIMGTINEILKNITKMLNSFNKALKFIFLFK